MKEKESKQARKEVFAVGGNLADGTRFEAGDPVPATLTDKERKTLEKMDAITAEGK